MAFGTDPYGTTPYGAGVTAPPPPPPPPPPPGSPGTPARPLPAVTSVPHLAIPFIITDNGSAQTVEQGSVDEIVQSVSNLIGTTPGTRYMVPRYGLPDPTFEGIDPVTLRQAVAKWEPRAVVTVNSAQGGQTTVSVSVA